MERSRGERRRPAKTAAAASATGSAVLVAMALYAAIQPQVAPLVNYAPDPEIGAANSGAVLWPMLAAVLALVASVAILRRPGRLSYLASGGVNLLMVGFALTMPSWLVTLDPLAVLLGVIGVVGLVASAAGWAISTPLPEAQPRWPTHHEVG